MSETSLRSCADLASCIEQLEPNAVVAVAHPATCAVTPLVADVAQRARNAGRAVVLFAPDGSEAARWRRRLAQAGLRDVPVRSLREAALALVAGAGDSFPRDGRLLDGNETDILLEDLKVSGIKPRRLREMVKFLNKGMADGSEGDPAWLINAEEQKLYDLLRENLEARRALAAPEVCARALEALATPGGAAAARKLVPEGALAIAPDFGTLSATGQRLVRALAPCGLVALSSSLQACNAEEDYPCPEGFTALEEAADASFALEPDAPAPRREEIVADNPTEEFDAVADRVATAVEGGTAPRDILVACPHRIWTGAIAKRLAERGIAAVVDEGPRKAKGDPREEARCGNLRTRALAKLLADPEDLVAWRSWLGLGDWLTRSDAFSALMARARGEGRPATEMLRELIASAAETPEGTPAAAESPLLRKLDGPIRAFNEVREALASASGAEAAAILENAGCALSMETRQALAAEQVPGVERVAALLLVDGSGTDAPESAPEDAPGAGNAVTLTSYRRAFGFHGSLAILCGLVSGFLPTLEATSDRETIEHRRRAYDRERILFEAVCATAADTLVLSRFEHDRIENADALAMDVARIYQEEGLRFATLAPSPYLTDTTPVPGRPTVVTRTDGLVAL